ncbi:MAG: hypothetical protein HJJLKODD_01874 [Phycisphaerae bacterium]|nr:hypothetical protein [Phycisphaerae bacterium]
MTRRIKFMVCGLLLMGWAAPVVYGQVVINEVFVNPPGSAGDDIREFIEFMGTPGMKLDGFAVVNLIGLQEKYYPLGSIPPEPTLIPEMDEFFSLDGQSLGKNGLLVIGSGSAGSYPNLLADTNFVQWSNLWNGGDTGSRKLENDGSTTFVLVRNRRGITQADPLDPLGLLWGKDVKIDRELITPVIDPQDGIAKDQFGDGNVDNGDGLDAFGVPVEDLKGKSTPADITDDLEMVDEFSEEHDRGWEYDFDDRHVDEDSTIPGLPYRHVHALDDPQGFQPDAYARVDYRTSGAGWLPATGGMGELPNGNNWQDTATEQWIRGESVGSSGGGQSPPYYYDNSSNPNPDSIQPYNTNVPLWLHDGMGVEYSFTTNSYEIMAGRMNPLAIPFIPGDVNRDGLCNYLDIAKVRAVFGNDNWIFSNSFAESAEGDDGDPAYQTRPWDVDGTGNNGIEASDLQWVLNFQGNTDGHVVGVRYDSTTPSTTGVYLNLNTGTAVTVTHALEVPSGGTPSNLTTCDILEMVVSAQVTSGANSTAGQENGVMQFVHDLTFSTPGVMKVLSVTPLNGYITTNGSLADLQGVDGDAGIKQINGYTTNFTRGLTGPVALYKVTMVAVGLGSTNISVTPATMTKFANSTPQGLKLGHTDNNGNPAGSSYFATVGVGVTSTSSSCQYILNLQNFPYDVAEGGSGTQQEQKSGPAVLSSTLNWIWWDSDVDPLGPPALPQHSQSTLYTALPTYNGNPSLDVYDATGVKNALQALRPLPYNQYGYNFSVQNNVDSQVLVKQIAQWLAYPIGTYGGYEMGHPLHVPALIPAFAGTQSYRHWMAVRGVISDVNPYPLPASLTVYGFWINDPIPGGIGENSFKTTSQFLSSYYQAVNLPGDAYHGKFVAVCEPPDSTEDVELVVPVSPARLEVADMAEIAELPVSVELQIEAAGRQILNDGGLNDTQRKLIAAALAGVEEQLAPYDHEFAALLARSEAQAPLFINGGAGADYFAVPFVLRNGVEVKEPITVKPQPATAVANKVRPVRESIKPVANLKPLPVLPTGTVIVVLIDAVDGHFLEASWSEQPVEYLPINRAAAAEILRKLLESEGIELKEAQKLAAELVHLEGSPYYPAWVIDGGEFMVTITQDGAASLIWQ